jgi:hypothetical protein
MQGTVEERLGRAGELLKARLDSVVQETTAIQDELDQQWGNRRLDLVPGTLVLEKAIAKFGTNYSKENGDGERLARLLEPDALSKELRDLLIEVTRE